LSQVNQGVVDLSTISGTTDIDGNNGGVFKGVLTGNVTFTFSNIPDGRAFSLAITQSSPVSSITWPTGTIWPDGIEPTVGAGKTGIFSFLKVGTAYYGTAIVNPASKPAYCFRETIYRAGEDIVQANGIYTFRAMKAFTLTEVRAAVTVPSVAVVNVDVKLNGSTIWQTGTSLTVDYSEKSSVTAQNAAVLASDPTSVADDDEFTIDILSDGSGGGPDPAAKGLQLSFIGTEA